MNDSTLVLVTGGSRGIGRHLAAGFAAAGHPVLLTATSAAGAERAAAEIAQQTGATVLGVRLDVADPESVAALLDTVTGLEAERGIRLGVLVNNAGVIESTEGPVWEADPADLVRVIRTNTIGPFLVVHRFVPHLLDVAAATGEPVRIIDLNSGSGATGTPQYAAYSASKAALFRLADSVHHFGWERGLRIFEMSPGVIESDMTRSMPIHDRRTGDDWTSPAALVDLALALAGGGLDAWSGRYVRAGVDTPESLAAAADGLAENTRRLRLDPREG